MNAIQPLIDLQETDARIRELEFEAKDIPLRKAQELAKMNGVNAQLAFAKSQLLARQQGVRNSEEEAKNARAKAQQLRISQATASSNNEYTQLDAEAARQDDLAGTADANVNKGKDDVTQAELDVAAAQKDVDELQGQVDALIAEYDARLNEVNKELEALKVERRAKANLVKSPRDLLYYERLRTKRWPVVVLLTDDNVCDGCHLVQPPNIEQRVKHNNGVVACTMCGRILYRDL